MTARIAGILFLLSIVSMLHHLLRPKRQRWHDFTWEIAMSFALASIITALTAATIG